MATADAIDSNGELTAMVTAMEMAETTTETADTPAGDQWESDEWDSEVELSDLDPWLSDSESD